jgi:hypothetical protein
MIRDMVSQNVQETVKKFQDNKYREFQKAQEQIKETTEALYKHQSEIQNRTNKEINGLRMKIERGRDSGYGKPQKKERNRTAKQNGRPIQQNRTNRRQNHRIQR